VVVGLSLRVTFTRSDPELMIDQQTEVILPFPMYIMVCTSEVEREIDPVPVVNREPQ
jgi:hypothetical protein